MNDFETVRQRIQGQNGVLAASALAALDRIEAEVERLRAERDGYKNEAQHRLNTMSELGAEVERLRAENKTLRMAAQPGVYEELSEYQHEVERLQRLVAAYEDIELVKEVERLRAALQDIVRFGDEVPHGFEAHDLQAIARNALAEEKE